MNPYLMLTAVLALGAVGGGGFWFGMDYKEGQVAEAENDKLREQAKAIDQLRARNDGLAQELEHEKRTRKVVYRDLKADADRRRDDPVYSRACIDERGVRNIDAALRGSHAEDDPGQLEATVPAADAATGDDRHGARKQNH